jgi:hypothetical protein
MIASNQSPRLTVAALPAILTSTRTCRRGRWPLAFGDG